MTDRSAMQATLDAYFDRLNEERYDEVVGTVRGSTPS